MTSRERILKAINHVETPELPVDFGATSATGINVSTLYPMLRALGLRQRPLVISDMMQCLAKMDEDIRQALCCDVIPLPSPFTKAGTAVTGQNVPFAMPDGTPALVDRTVKWTVNEKGHRFIPAGPHGRASLHAHACGRQLF